MADLREWVARYGGRSVARRFGVNERALRDALKRRPSTYAAYNNMVEAANIEAPPADPGELIQPSSAPTQGIHFFESDALHRAGSTLGTFGERGHWAIGAEPLPMDRVGAYLDYSRVGAAREVVVTVYGDYYGTQANDSPKAVLSRDPHDREHARAVHSVVLSWAQVENARAVIDASYPAGTRDPAATADFANLLTGGHFTEVYAVKIVPAKAFSR